MSSIGDNTLIQRDTYNRFKGFVEEYIDGWESDDDRIVVGCLDEFLEETNLNDYLNDLDVSIDDIADEIWERFTQEYFNDWEKITDRGFHYWFSGESPYEDLDNHFTISDFIYLYNECVNWFKTNYDVNVEVKSEIHIWNTITYWCFKTGDFSFQKDRLKDWIKEEKDRVIKEKETIVEFSGKSRLTCVICLDNKVIYTGCSTCSSGLLCYECYTNVNNVCPVCRCSTMIKCVKCYHFVKISNDNGVVTHYKLDTDRVDWEKKIANVVGAIKEKDLL